jgi:flagellar P-ring protein precursor FlgI
VRRLRDSLPAAIALAIVALCALAAPARATTIQDLCRIKGHEENILVGLGIVVGLDGTGDTSRDSYIAARPYARLLSNLGAPVPDLAELEEADAYAIVQVSMTVPPTGAREGDLFDVQIEKLFNATSLRGGRLVVSLLRVPGPDSPDAPVYARAAGAVVVTDDDLTSGVVRTGGKMLRDIRTKVVADDGSLTIVLKSEYASFPTAVAIMDAINGPVDETAMTDLPEYRRLAVVEDPKNIRIRVPEADRERPAAFISWLMTTPVDPALIAAPARIVINERQGIIVVSGDVRLGPVGVSHRNMQLRTAAPAPSGRWTGLDPAGGQGRQSTQLSELLLALDTLDVSVDDQIAIIYELKKTGALHAEIVHE